MTKPGQKAKPPEEKKVSHHFKLAPHIKWILEVRSAELELTKTGYVENLIEADGKKLNKR